MIEPFRLRASLTNVKALLLVLGAAAFVSGCVSSRRIEDHTTNRSSTPGAQVDGVVELLDRLPTWVHISADDRTTKHEIFRLLDTLAKTDPLVLREGMGRFIALRKETELYTVYDMCKLFLLNRYVFDVPDTSKSFNPGAFGGWYGIPTTPAGNLKTMWPLNRKPSGEIELIGHSIGFLGADYLAIEEFDFLKRKFGFRYNYAAPDLATKPP